MSECIFCNIVNNQIPAWVIYQNQDVICFLPNPPEVYGHTLIAPKQHIMDIYAAPESILGSMMAASKKLALHYKTQIGASGINVLHASGASAQQSVFHFHIHLFPRFENDGLNTWPQLPATSFDKDEMLNKLSIAKWQKE